MPKEASSAAAAQPAYGRMVTGKASSVPRRSWPSGGAPLAPTNEESHLPNARDTAVTPTAVTTASTPT